MKPRDTGIVAIPSYHMAQILEIVFRGNNVIYSTKTEFLDVQFSFQAWLASLLTSHRELCMSSQAGSWAGNLMLTHDHDNFPSDVFTMMAAAGAKVTVGKMAKKL